MTPFLSVIVPCQNEVRFLGRCLDSILASDYPAEHMEVLVMDGGSRDGTRELMEGYRRDSRIRCIDNPGGTTPAALNLGIRAARGQIVGRLDAHAAVVPNYFTRAVAHLQSSGADHVGGVMRTRPQESGAWAAAIVAALTHPFGVGDSHFRTGASDSGSSAARLRFVDTVFGGCWRRDVFERIGYFNERLLRGQDMEFHQRLTRAGGKILLAPDLVTDYYARSRLRAFWRHNWSNGVWAVLPFAYSAGAPVRPRHLVPLALIATVCVAPWVALVYAAVNIGASIHTALRHRRWQLLAQMPVAFASLHFAYGAGSAWGLLRLAGILLLRGAGKETA